mmetsp:Transcript_54399/g.172840  ORF Transcript_54399/g.172840 Transcript_54399/m.172840 type:complete len:263 (-) Transcript_54399:45-833(-)
MARSFPVTPAPQVPRGAFPSGGGAAGREAALSGHPPPQLQRARHRGGGRGYPGEAAAGGGDAAAQRLRPRVQARALARAAAAAGGGGSRGGAGAREGHGGPQAAPQEHQGHGGRQRGRPGHRHGRNGVCGGAQRCQCGGVSGGAAELPAPASARVHHLPEPGARLQGGGGGGAPRRPPTGDERGGAGGGPQGGGDVPRRPAPLGPGSARCKRTSTGAFLAPLRSRPPYVSIVAYRLATSSSSPTPRMRVDLITKQGGREAGG